VVNINQIEWVVEVEALVKVVKHLVHQVVMETIMQ
jgi:hypothetical protein